MSITKCNVGHFPYLKLTSSPKGTVILLENIQATLGMNPHWIWPLEALNRTRKIQNYKYMFFIMKMLINYHVHHLSTEMVWKNL